MQTTIKFDAMPLYVGAFDSPHNPAGIPNTYPFELAADEASGCLYQRTSADLDRLLEKAYAIGSTVGNPMDQDEFARRYCEDFLAFVCRHAEPHHRSLEIGAGRGYLCKRLHEAGFDLTAVEPGANNKPYWQRYGVEVIHDFFPTAAAPGPFDRILSYGVLEHIDDLPRMLGQISSHLGDDGRMLAAVPDCELEIASGDPGMLIHEHFRYFTESSLQTLLALNGFRVIDMQKSAYGRSLYVAAVRSPAAAPAGQTAEALAYFDKITAFTDLFCRRIGRMGNLNKIVGLYCPARILNVLPRDASVRFFDDAEDLHGKFFPPFNVPVESRAQLLAAAPDEVWVISRTFGEKIAAEITAAAPNIVVRTLGQLEARDGPS